MCRPPTFVVHSPYELPIVRTLKRFSYKQQLEVWITPEVTTTDNDLRSFDPDERKCYFEDERKLKYFKTYTKNNCEMECKSFASKLKASWILVDSREYLIFLVFKNDSFSKNQLNNLERKRC